MEEDYNEFSSLDSGLAACMLAGAPAVMYYVFSGHDYLGTAMLLGVALGVGLVTLLIARFTNSSVVSRLMQVIGVVLCIAYWGYAIHMWAKNNRLSPPAPAAELPAAAES